MSVSRRHITPCEPHQIEVAFPILMNSIDQDGVIDASDVLTSMDETFDQLSKDQIIAIFHRCAALANSLSTLDESLLSSLILDDLPPTVLALTALDELQEITFQDGTATCEFKISAIETALRNAAH